MQHLLDVTQLRITHADRCLVDGLDLHVQRGETHALVGESGSGKSISALSLLGLLPRSLQVSGSITLDGMDLSLLDERTLIRHRGQTASFIFQEPMTTLNPLHTIGKQVMEAIALHRKRTTPQLRHEAMALLDRVKLGASPRWFEAFPHTLSGGQRVMIAMAMANRPSLLIADEPTTALDVTVARDILDLLDEIKNSEGMGLLLITHDLNLVRRYADNVSVMRAGKCIEQGTVQQVLAAPATHYTRELIAAEPEGCPHPVEPQAREVLSIENLSVTYPAQRRWFRKAPPTSPTLTNISLTVKQGETLGVVGESGSGKSTLAKTILGLQPGEGKIVFLGQRVDRWSLYGWGALRNKLQYVFQDPYGALSPRMSVFDIVSEGLRYQQPHLSLEQVHQRVSKVLQDVELNETFAARYPNELSGGQRARIALARVLILNPALLILDEPTAALDRLVQKKLIALLRDLQVEYGLSYLFISHDLSVVKALAHRVLVLKAGQVVEQGNTHNLFHHPQSSYTRRLVER
ncbi:ABC transporter ATP-binding protein [Candidatus Symbiopectobacterium sp. NZEC135]|uniref:ABC transporter ATP-binding protein n=1 Tax=Candidatus Symbiopectobacterium sp. NZEC135 TaxID=2820471 RepID=UPI002227FE01|nr:ATP-binding cassette domain-containing protein [Candidatus Symbiopectobacterium sp. NZEC135]MCW2482188.1 ABC transporter ATP-binding protein [Candidatus Symbiopectobacterium sp. NZEC135]